MFQITKARLPIYVKESVEEKVLKKRKYREEKYPEEENNAEGGKISEKEKNAEESRSAVGDSEEFPSVPEESVVTTTTGESVDPEEEENPPRRGRKPTTARAERKPNNGKDLEEEKNDEYDGKEKFSSQEYQNFLKEKAKSAFDSLFGNLRMVLDGKKDPSELTLRVHTPIGYQPTWEVAMINDQNFSRYYCHPSSPC